jgi:hypothetical protein
MAKFLKAQDVFGLVQEKGLRSLRALRFNSLFFG